MSMVSISVRVLMAIIIGGLIGYEREMRNRPAGFVTHILVCVGACVVSLMQLQMVHDTVAMIEQTPALASAMKADLGRVVAQVITGVGFLGAGTIIFDKGSVKGLTTASTIWLVACIGLVIGLGYYQIAIVASAGILFVMVVLKQLEVKARNRKFIQHLEMTYDSQDKGFIERTAKMLRKNKVQIRDIRLMDSQSEDTGICRFLVYFGIARNRERIIEKLLEQESVLSLTRLF